MPKKTLWSIYGLFLVCGIAQAAIVPLLPRLSSQYGLSPSETGLLLALPGLATLAVSVPAGLLADRIGARRCTIIAGAVLSVACIAQAMPSLALLLAGRALFGVAFGVVWTTGVAWLAEVDAAHGGSRIGPTVTCASVGMMFGPALGGLLAGAGATGLPFMLIAGASALVMVPLTLGRARGVPGLPDVRRLPGLRSLPGLRGRQGAGVVAAVAGDVAGDPSGRPGEITLTRSDETAEMARAVGYSETAEMGRTVGYSETAEMARAVGYSETAEMARAVGYSETAEMATSFGYSEPVPYAGESPGGRLRALTDALRQPGVVAATGALVVSGGVSSVSQLLISGGLHHDGLSSGRIGLAFSMAAISYIAVSTAVVRLGKRVHNLRFNAVATCGMAVVLVPALLSGSATILIATLMLASMPRAAVSTISYSLASSNSAANGGGSPSRNDGSVFGMVNGAWAGSMVLMPLLAGALEQHGGARVGFLAVIVPATAIALALLARSRTRPVPAGATVAG